MPNVTTKRSPSPWITFTFVLLLNFQKKKKTIYLLVTDLGTNCHGNWLSKQEPGKERYSEGTDSGLYLCCVLGWLPLLLTHFLKTLQNYYYGIGNVLIRYFISVQFCDRFLRGQKCKQKEHVNLGDPNAQTIALILWWGLHSQPNHLPKVPPPNTVTLGVRVQRIYWGT